MKCLSGINKLPNITQLTLLELPALRDLAELESLKQLQVLCFNPTNALVMKSLGRLQSLKMLCIISYKNFISSLEGIENSSSMEMVALAGSFANTNLQALEQLPNLKVVALLGAYDSSDEDCCPSAPPDALEQLASLTLPAGVRVLKYQEDMGEDDASFVELGRFQDTVTHNLASDIVAMMEDKRPIGTSFMAHQGTSLPTIYEQEYRELFRYLV